MHLVLSEIINYSKPLPKLGWIVKSLKRMHSNVLQRCNDTMKECRILRKGLICTYSIFIYGWRIGVRHIFFRISGRSISNAVGKIIFMAYLEVRLRFGLFSRTLLRTNWHQVVAISRLSDVMGFTDMIRRQPQVKERHKNRIGVKEAEKYYKYVYLLACKSLLILINPHCESYFFDLLSEDGAHSCLCNNLCSVVLYTLNSFTSI